ncbi:hypothetical protein MCOR02_003779 [Pyricularia oryzae]|nr:hypothetical protein MCOR02_003779 [Pyricularia oryzae]KAI6575348.1 hypothetical protein MCOR04_007033 [Pyricularia oryzae]
MLGIPPDFQILLYVYINCMEQGALLLQNSLPYHFHLSNASSFTHPTKPALSLSLVRAVQGCNGLPITERGSAADLPRSPRKTRRDEKKIFQPAQNSQDGAIEAVIFPGELPRNRLLRHCYFSLKHQGNVDGGACIHARKVHP